MTSQTSKLRNIRTEHGRKFINPSFSSLSYGLHSRINTNHKFVVYAVNTQIWSRDCTMSSKTRRKYEKLSRFFDEQVINLPYIPLWSACRLVWNVCTQCIYYVAISIAYYIAMYSPYLHKLIIFIFICVCRALWRFIL